MTAANRILLGVNIDHVATLRQARGTRYPDPVKAALDAEEAGADGITVHLREDRRHIQDRDVRVLAEVLQTRMNFEMGVTEYMLALAEEALRVAQRVHPEVSYELRFLQAEAPTAGAWTPPTRCPRSSGRRCLPASARSTPTHGSSAR